MEDPELTVQVQAQNPRNLDGALRIAQRMEAVFQTVHSRVSKPVPVVNEAMAGQEVQVSEKDLWVEQLAKAKPTIGPVEGKGSRGGGNS